MCLGPEVPGVSTYRVGVVEEGGTSEVGSTLDRDSGSPIWGWDNEEVQNRNRETPPSFCYPINDSLMIHGPVYRP